MKQRLLLVLLSFLCSPIYGQTFSSSTDAQFSMSGHMFRDIAGTPDFFFATTHGGANILSYNVTFVNDGGVPVKALFLSQSNDTGPFNSSSTMSSGFSPVAPAGGSVSWTLQGAPNFGYEVWPSVATGKWHQFPDGSTPYPGGSYTFDMLVRIYNEAGSTVLATYTARLAYIVSSTAYASGGSSPATGAFSGGVAGAITITASGISAPSAETEVSFRLNMTDYNPAEGVVRLFVDGVQVSGDLATIGLETGSPNAFIVELTSVDGSLHDKDYYWEVDGVTVATGHTPDEDYEVGNPFAMEDTIVRHTSDSPEIESPATPPRAAWVGPDGDAGDPVTADMTKADYRDAVRQGIAEAFDAAFGDIGGTPSGVPGTSEVNAEGQNTEGIDGAGDSFTGAVAGLGGAVSQYSIPSPYSFPSTSEKKYSFSVPALVLPGYGALGSGFDVDLTPYSSGIALLRSLFLLVNSVVASYAVVRIIRTSSADS